MIQIIHPWHLREEIGEEVYREKIDEKIDKFEKRLKIERRKILMGKSEIYLVGYGDLKSNLEFHFCLAKTYGNWERKEDEIFIGEKI